MTLHHAALGVLVAFLWGLNFVFVRIGLETLPPLLMAAMRFAIAAIPALVIAPPSLSPGRALAIAATLFVGQFGFLFSGMALGMPAGLASVTLQAQALFTTVIAAVFLHEIPSLRGVVGLAIASAGLTVVGSTTGTHSEIPLTAFLFVIAAAASWGTGNVLLRGAGRIDMLAAVVWLSLIPPLPLLGLSLWFEGPGLVIHSLSHIGWSGTAAVLYLGIPTTIIGYGLWGHLLKIYPAATVVPFALLVPFFGTLSGMIVLSERFGGLRLVGMGIVLVGLAVMALPWSTILGNIKASKKNGP